MAASRVSFAQLAAGAVGHVRGVVSKKQENAKRNVVVRGLMMLTHQVCGVLTSVTLGCLCLMGVLWTEESCSSKPVDLIMWFRFMLALQVMSTMFFILMQIGLVSLMKHSAADSRSLSEAEEDPEQDVDSLKLNLPMSAAVMTMLLTLLLLAWSVIGLIVAVDVNLNNTWSQCGFGRSYIWYVVFFVLFQMRCCHAWSVKDAHDDEDPTDVALPSQREAEASLAAQGAEAAAPAAQGVEAGEAQSVPEVALAEGTEEFCIGESYTVQV